jgi:hypothetical protein
MFQIGNNNATSINKANVDFAIFYTLQVRRGDCCALSRDISLFNRVPTEEVVPRER